MAGKSQSAHLQKLYKDVEIQYGLAGLSPRQRATRVIRRMKYLYESHIMYVGLEGNPDFDGMLYLFSENCEMTWEQKDFAIHWAFRNGFATSTNSIKNSILDSLARWGIIDALKLYNDDEKAGIKWFESRNISMQNVHKIIDSGLFGNIVRKYPELKSLKNKYSADAYSIKVSKQQIETWWTQAMELIQKGDYDRSHYDLFNVLGPRMMRNHDVPRDLVAEMKKQMEQTTTKEKMIKLLDLFYYDFGWLDPNIIIKIDDKLSAHIRQVLGVRPGEENIENFDLKNSRDIARCKEIFPLAISYPQVFMGWYPREGSSYYLGVRPIFVPGYDNGLAKKRTELHYRLANKRLLGRILSKTVVPEKLGKAGDAIEQTVADKILYRNRRPGRK